MAEIINFDGYIVGDEEIDDIVSLSDELSELKKQVKKLISSSKRRKRVVVPAHKRETIIYRD